jgi:hypothetical protein
MAKEDVYTLEGKLARKPKTGTSYFRTRKEIAKKLESAKVGEEHMFVRIGNVKLEDEKFTIPLKINRSVVFSEGTSDSDDWNREFAIDDLGIVLEEHFGIGKGEEVEGQTEEQKKVKDEERKVRLREMEKNGVIPISYFSGFEEKDFES